MEGLHSPFGVLGQIKDKRGYTDEQVLWGQSWIKLMLEMADAPRYVKGGKQAAMFENAEQLKKALEYNKK